MTFSREDQKIFLRGISITLVVVILGASALIFYSVAPEFLNNIGAILAILFVIGVVPLIIFGVVVGFLCMPDGGYDDYY